MKAITWSLLFLSTILSNIAFTATSINLLDPNLFQEMQEDHREYKDCNVVGSQFQCGAGSPEGYTCQQVRSEDIFEDNEEQIVQIRRFILGQNEGDAKLGKQAGTTCSEERAGFLSSIINRITLYDRNMNPISPLVNHTQATPQTNHPKIHHPEQNLSTLSLGCVSNKCAKDEALPVPVLGEPNYNRFSQYRCQPRMICRCMEDGESLNSPGAKCCDGLAESNGICGIDSQVLAASTTSIQYLPDHVDESTGVFSFLKDPENPEAESPALVALFNNTIQMKALEWFSYNQSEDSMKCLPDNLALKKIGRKLIAPQMQEITQKYNDGMAELQNLKTKYIQYSQQIRDPKAFFKAQGTISYRGKTMTEEEFEIFVRNSTGGSEVFNLMADEQRIQLIYENQVGQLLDELSKEGGKLDKMRKEFEYFSHNSSKKGIGSAFGESFGCRKKLIFGIFKRRLKKRWRSQYRIIGGVDGNFESFKRPATDENMAFFEGFMNQTLLGQRIFNKGKSKKSFKLTEPLVAGAGLKKYHDFGIHASTFWSNQQPHYMTGAKGLESIKEFYRESIYKYFKEQYFDKGYEITDVAFGGLRVCIDSSEDVPFQIKTAQACQRYQKAMDLLVEAGYALFLQSSYGGREYDGGTLNSKSDFYLAQQQSAANLMRLYNKLSDIPDEFGGLSFLDQTGIDFKAKFDEINGNNRFRGYLRLKSYLFFKARANSIAGNVAVNSLGTGSAVPDLGNIYGTPARLLNPNQRPETTAQNLQTKTAELRASNILATQAAQDARNREDFLAINKNSSGSIASSKGDRLISKLNEKATKFLKENPSAAKSIAKAQVIASDANKKLSSAIGATLAKPATVPLPSSGKIQSLSDSKDSKADTAASTKKNLASSAQPYAPKMGTMGQPDNGSVYREKTQGSSSSSNNSQLTTLSDYELGKAIENVENQPHLFKSDQDDSIFSKISKTYARSYDRFLAKKQRSGTQRVNLESKKKTKMEKLLNDI